MNSTLKPQSATLEDTSALVARLLLAAMFLLFVYYKVGVLGYGTMIGYLAKLGVPAPELLFPLILAYEILTAVLLVIGYKTRIVALVAAAWCIATALVAHAHIADPNQLNNMLKNIGLAAGCLALAAAGAGQYSVDGRRRNGI